MFRLMSLKHSPENFREILLCIGLKLRLSALTAPSVNLCLLQEVCDVTSATIGP